MLILDIRFSAKFSVIFGDLTPKIANNLTLPFPKYLMKLFRLHKKILWTRYAGPPGWNVAGGKSVQREGVVCFDEVV